ncbi:MAG: hypothetical protein AAFU68_00755 [Pseudomonadota bacterium]
MTAGAEENSGGGAIPETEDLMRAEVERLRALADALSRRHARPESSATEIADLQDRNLDAFERMNGAAGAAALELFKNFAQTKRDDGSLDVFSDLAGVLQSASDERDALLRAFVQELQSPPKDRT